MTQVLKRCDVSLPGIIKCLDNASLKGGVSDWSLVFRQEALLSDLRKSVRGPVFAELSNAISAIFGNPRKKLYQLNFLDLQYSETPNESM